MCSTLKCAQDALGFVCECVCNVHWSVSSPSVPWVPALHHPVPYKHSSTGERRCMRGGLYYLSVLIHVNALCPFPCDISEVEKKATKQRNGEKDLQHSTIELKEAWRMKQMPRLPLTIAPLPIATYLWSLVCRSHVQVTGNTTGYQGCYITRAPRNYMRDILYGIRFHPPHPLFTGFFHLSSLMNRCCSAVGVNMMDWVAGRHILLLRERRGSSGQWTACRGALTPLCFSPSFFLIAALIFDIRLWHSSLSPSPSTPPPTVLSILALVSHSVRLIIYL